MSYSPTHFQKDHDNSGLSQTSPVVPKTIQYLSKKAVESSCPKKTDRNDDSSETLPPYKRPKYRTYTLHEEYSPDMMYTRKASMTELLNARTADLKQTTNILSNKMNDPSQEDESSSNVEKKSEVKPNNSWYNFINAMKESNIYSKIFAKQSTSESSVKPSKQNVSDDHSSSPSTPETLASKVLAMFAEKEAREDRAAKVQEWSTLHLFIRAYMMDNLSPSSECGTIPSGVLRKYHDLFDELYPEDDV